MKLVATDVDEEPGRDILRAYHREHAHPGYTTSFCLAEALGAFKLKFLRKRISQRQYIENVKDFIRLSGNTFQVDEVPILSPLVIGEAERLIQTHQIDFVDAFQIVTIVRGQFRIFVAESKSILITADRGLARAARAEDVRVWECTSEPPRPGR